MKTGTIFDAYSDFQASNTKVNKSTLRSVIHRFLAEHWGGEAPKGAKATNEEVFELIDSLKKLPATLLIDSMDILEKEFATKSIAKENSKSYKSAYKVFLEWAEANNYCEQVKEQNLKPSVQQQIFTRHKKGSGTKQKRNYHNRSSKQPFALTSKDGNSQQLIYADDYVNSALANELKLFERFRSENHNCSFRTIQKDISIIYRILGWLHRYKDIPLEDLSLDLIIKFIKLNVFYSHFRDEKGEINYQDYVNRKAMVRQEAVELANENRKLIEEYLDFIGGHPNTKVIVIGLCIAVAKFIFRGEIGTDEYINDTDLPIVRRLNQLSNIFSKKAKSTLPSVAHADKSISWQETFNILEVLRKRIHCLKTEYVYIPKQTNKQRICKKLRSKNAIINDLQIFLSLAFMVLIPTDRARTYYELEIGKTFVYGIYKDGKFTPVEKLQDKTVAIWYIHLMPDDYKTGKIYKEYWGIMPNIQFDHNHNLYSYIDKWINEGRQYGGKCNHDYFFRQIKRYKALTTVDWNVRIKAIFVQETGIPVTPKELRKMYITHLNNKGATNTELKGAAYAMHHSQKMQEGVYNSQTIMDRVQPIQEFNERMFKEVFNSGSQE